MGEVDGVAWCIVVAIAQLRVYLLLIIAVVDAGAHSADFVLADALGVAKRGRGVLRLVVF